MFSKDNLHKITYAGDFSVWAYFPADRADAEAARNLLGYFPADAIKPGDALYIRDQSLKTTHHWADKNPHDGQIAVWLFGG